MAVTDVHRTKIATWLVLSMAIKENDLRRSRSDTEVFVAVTDNMTLLNNETNLDAALIPLEATEDTARVAEIDAEIVKLNTERDDITGRP